YQSGYGDIATLHFIWEGANTFYVTGYNEHGSEIGRYNDLMMQQRYQSGYGDIATLHFIWEGANTFYVTGYNEHGSEIGRYNDLMMQQR
nr:hypothetical protein [Tanacetum cinerariifolium]